MACSFLVVVPTQNDDRSSKQAQSLFARDGSSLRIPWAASRHPRALSGCRLSCFAHVTRATLLSPCHLLAASFVSHPQCSSCDPWECYGSGRPVAGERGERRRACFTIISCLIRDQRQTGKSSTLIATFVATPSTRHAIRDPSSSYVPLTSLSRSIQSLR